MKDKYLKKSEGSHLIEPDNPGYMGDYTVTTEDSDLSMRLGPGDSYDKAGSIPKGATVAVYASQNGWYYVEYDGKNGWSKSKYLTKGTVSEDEETKEDQSQPEEEETETEESSEEDQGEDTADTQQEQQTDDSGESSEEE